MEKKDKPRVKILVCCHKPGKWLSDDVYMPIQCGKAISDIDLGIQGDDTGDNISAKNPNYCELTAMYWAWKNLKDVDYIGLCHYRRYFNFSKKNHFIRKEYDSLSMEDFSYKKDYIVPAWISNYDIILPESRSFPISLMETHIHNGSVIDFCILERVILNLYPEYRNSLLHVFYHMENIPQRNMFLIKKDLFDEYSKWLFNILFTVEKYVKISEYKYDKRIFGFMGEMLLPLYFYHNRYKITKRRLIFIDTHKSKSAIYFAFKTLFYKIRFLINTFLYNTLISDRNKNILIDEGLGMLYKDSSNRSL